MDEEGAIIELLQVLTDISTDVNRIAVALERINEKEENNSEAG